MASAAGPNIVEDGLVLSLDAGNTQSYPGSSNVSLLLHGDGTNGSTTFTDSSINNHTITANGNAQISTTQSKFGGSSMYFDGNGDYLTVADSDDFHIGTGDFTIEAWLYKGSKGTYHTLVGQRVNSTSEWRIILDLNTAGNGYSEGRLRFDWGSVAYNWDAGIPVDTWTHIAIVRSGTTGTLYVDGTAVTGNPTLNNISNYSAPLRIGTNDGTGEYYQGYIDDLRITKGLARYTSNFTPPTTALADPATQWTDLIGNNDGTLVNSVGFDSNNLGSLSFDGTDDYVDVSSSALGLSAGTLCFWIKSSVVKDIYNTHSGSWNQNTLYGSGAYIVLRISDGTSNPGDVGINSSLVFDGNFHWVCTQWTTGGERSIWVDGTKRASLSGTRQYTPGTTLEIGYKSWSAGYYNGTMSNIMSFNRALSASEMQQNYNALKGRYGY